jgi:hypothetical protein
VRLRFWESRLKTKILFLFAALAMTPMTALAHAPHVGAHGGPQTDAGSFHVEVVAKDTSLVVYLVDHSSREVATAGFQGVAILNADGKVTNIPLAAAGDNRLTGTFAAPLGSEFKGVVRITTPTGSTVQGKF